MAVLGLCPGGRQFLVIASAHALVVSPFKPRYVAAKHGVLGLVRTLALEGAEYDICATAICPAYLRTPLVEKQVAAQATAVAELAAFLLGPNGRSFTGVPVSNGPKDGPPDESHNLPARHQQRRARERLRCL